MFLCAGNWLRRRGRLQSQIWTALGKLCRRRIGLRFTDVVLESLDEDDGSGRSVAVHVFGTESFGHDPELIGDFVYEALLEELAPEYETQLELGHSYTIDCEVPA
jgi:hypothetical protein